MFKLLKNARVLLPDFSIKKGNILIQDENIYGVYDLEHIPNKPFDSEIELEGHLIFPGLINSHDHLIDTCWKELGKCPVSDWHEWHTSVHSTDEYKRMQRLSVADLYTVGMYKNIISGITTVVDHFPPEVSGTFVGHNLISLMDHIYVAHSVSENRLEWCSNLQEHYKKTNGILPFIVHVCEGNTKELHEEIESLNRLGALNSNTILVNGVYLEEADIKLISAKKASLIWLPNSNARLYGRQPNIKLISDLGIPVAIGTDSSDTGSTTLHSEFKTALNYSKDYLANKITARTLVEMTTINAAKILGIDKEVGSIASGKVANLIVFEDNQEYDPFDIFLNLNQEDFRMVVHKGKMVFGDSEFRKIPTVDFSQYTEIRLNGKSKLLYGRPLQLIERIRHKLTEDIVFPFFNIESDE